VNYRHWWTTIVGRGIPRFELGVVRRVLMELPQAALMRGWSGDRQGYRDENAHEQQNQQQSGGQGTHECLVEPRYEKDLW
jgi:hypothetical protein